MRWLPEPARGDEVVSGDDQPDPTFSLAPLGDPATAAPPRGQIVWPVMRLLAVRPFVHGEAQPAT